MRPGGMPVARRRASIDPFRRIEVEVDFTSSRQVDTWAGGGMNHLSIGDVGQRAGLNPSAIRYYERVGLLPEPARVNGRRRYDAGILKHLALVRMAQEAGFTIEEIRTLVSGFPAETPPGERWRELARRKRPEVDALISRMLVVRQVLEESLRCDCLTLDACADHGWSTGPREQPAG